MTRTPAGATPRLVAALAQVAKRQRLARKLVVAPNVAAGRELLRRLSLARGGWIGFEVTTPRPLALRLARASMEEVGLGTLDTFDEQALLDHALDAALVGESGGLGELSEGVGFRQKVHDSIRALRLAGVDARQLGRARLTDGRKRRFLLRVLERYERLLTDRRRADTAAVFELALATLEEAGARAPESLDADTVLLMPGMGIRGLAGRLLSALGARGAKVLETDPVIGLEQPKELLWNRSKSPAPGSWLFAPESEREDGDEGLDIDLFAAGSIDDELREVLRRVADRGLRWDQVEIVASDAAAYGSALHALSARLRIPVTYAVGLPIERTRTGRVVRAYLDWIEEGFQAGPIRRLLEAGDLRPPRAKREPTAAALARRFRVLRIGWGRKRYRSQLREALAGVDRMEREKRQTEESFVRERERVRSELLALRSILFPPLKATPAVPDRMGAGGGPVSPAELSRGLQSFLKRVPKGRGPDRSAREEVSRILERVEATLGRRTDFRAAIAILRAHLDIRVRAEQTGADPEDRDAPWGSGGGALHVTDFEHGGYSGREAVFVVGLDADRVPGPRSQDPVLLDSDRRVLNGALPTSIELMHERVYRLAALVARIRGALTASFTVWNPSEARAAGPSSLLLQILRLSRRDGTLAFDDLDDALGGVATSIPGSGRAWLDGRDVWMGALGGDGVLKAGVDRVRESFPFLDRGLAARDARLKATPGPVHGVVTPRRDALDPRANPEVVLSASRLEELGRCPLRYLHRSVLRAHPPDDPELDPDRWLDPLRRGRLLHRVYEASLRRAREEGVAHDDAAFEQLALDVLASRIQKARYATPVPGEGAFRRDLAALEEDVRSFVRMVRQLGARWIKLELSFGLGGEEPLMLDLGEGVIHVRGAIDRVDEDLSGVRVIDYKTGRTGDFSRKTGAFHGGRRLQHAVYARAAEVCLGGDVVAGEYHYPTRRGENQVFSFGRVHLAGLDELLGHMLDGVAAGSFVPTDEPSDCTFCDYAAVCRVRKEAWGKIDAPLADWSKELLNTGLSPSLLHLKHVRGFED